MRFGCRVWSVGSQLRSEGSGVGICSGSEAGSYLRLIDFVYHLTLGLRVLKKKRNTRGRSVGTRHTRVSLLVLSVLDSGPDCLICADCQTCAGFARQLYGGGAPEDGRSGRATRACHSPADSGPGCLICVTVLYAFPDCLICEPDYGPDCLICVRAAAVGGGHQRTVGRDAPHARPVRSTAVGSMYQRISMYVCMYVCMYVSIYLFIYQSIYLYICIDM